MKLKSLTGIAWALLLINAPVFIGTETVFACGPGGGGFLPENKLDIPPVPFGALATVGGVTESEFNSVLDKISGFYAPIIKAHGGSLRIDRLWSNGTVNAYAKQEGGTWIIEMYGGLARHQAITPDGFALVACHELGHHLGGVPKYAGQWAANEGQADYFANLKCLRRVWEGDDNVSIVQGLGVPASVTANCEKSFSDGASIAICQREAMAGYSSADLMHYLDNSPAPSFDRSDSTVVSQTQDTHPKAQCRLDTYYQASRCQIKYQEEIGQSDPTVGTCSMEKGDKFGYRPQCWYKPGGTTPGPGPTPNPGGDIAGQPTINGQTNVTVLPNQQFAVDYDVSRFQGATGAYMEFVGPNRDFAEPNGTRPDPYRALFGSQAVTRGRFVITRPIYVGTYRIRVIPLGGQGNYAVGRFSNASTLRVQQGAVLTSSRF